MDSEDPYADVDISSLPNWWQRLIEEFEEYGLRPYRPPRFQDGALKYKIVEELERQLDVTIWFRSTDVNYEGDWTVMVDDQGVAEVGHHRSPTGYTVFEIRSEEFKKLVQSYS